MEAEIDNNNTNNKIWWKEKKTILIFTSIIGFTTVAASYLWLSNQALTSGPGLADLTNAFTFTIELGIAVFVSVAIFQYSNFQQSESERILKKLKAVQDNLGKARISRKVTYQQAIIDCFKDIWMKCTLIMLTLDLHGAEEDERDYQRFFEGKLSVADVIEAHIKQLSLALQLLQTLTEMLASDVESTMITKLLKFKIQSMNSILQTGYIRDPLPWSTMIIEINRIIKEYFPSSIGEFKIKDVQHVIAEEYKDELKQGRT